MTMEFRLPDLGEGVKEGQVMRLLVAEGDAVTEDQPLMEVETDKAAVEIASPYTGVVTTIHVQEKQVVNVGDVMVTFSDGAKGKAVGAPPPRTEKPASSVETTKRSVDGPTPSMSKRKPASPAVRKLARKLGVDLEQVKGSGPGGRVTREDVEQVASGNASATAKAPAHRSKAPGIAVAGGTPVESPPPAPPPPSAQPTAPVLRMEIQGREDSDEFGAIVREPLTQTRKKIAEVMTRSIQTVPHVTDTDDADVTELDRLRRGYSSPQQPDRKLSMLAFVMRAVVKALQMYPVFNASLDQEAGEIVYKRYYNMTIGVQTARGLIGPVVRDVDRMTIPQISKALDEMIEKTRNDAFSLADMQGGTYTISNAGAMGGSRYSTPIITLPQVAVLALGKSTWRPWVPRKRDGSASMTIEPRLILPLSHSMDHRIIDGAMEIAFMQQIIGDLENPARLLL